jgi:meso-butanediol dehydrogenase/(S,S)-butanediol dehydrogenase/diacetyl reductase
MDLKDTVAIVTGGARGIGRGIALSLAREGVRLAVADLPAVKEDRERTAREARDAGSEALTLDVDVRQWPQVQAMVEQTIQHFGKVDILVNNAGVISIGAVVAMEEEEWDRVLDINLKGTFLCCKAVIPHLVERGGGRIINMSSQAGKRGRPVISHYCASKFAIIGFTQSLAQELGPSNITVNAVCPGEVQTAMWDDHLSPALALGGYGPTPQEAWDEFIKREVPLGRPQTAEDIGEAVVFLCKAENITGEALNVTGGSEMA